MTLSKDEYKIEDNGIWISKDALVSWREQYAKEADRYKKEDLRYGIYLGKSCVFMELLKMFEPWRGDK